MLVAQPRGSSGRLAATALAGVAAWNAAGAFVQGFRPQAARAGAVGLRGWPWRYEGVFPVEAPPSDAELWGAATSAPRPELLQLARELETKQETEARELDDEAQRMRPFIEPLVEKQYSVKEITFALNRMGSKLRPLLYSPPYGNPVFTETHVEAITKRTKTANGVLHDYVRPQSIPSRVPGAHYPEVMKQFYSEVPKLAEWSGEPTGEVQVDGLLATKRELKAQGLRLSTELKLPTPAWDIPGAKEPEFVPLAWQPRREAPADLSPQEVRLGRAFKK